MVEYKIDTSNVKKLIKRFIELGNTSKTFFDLLGITVDQMTKTTFRMLGARSGMPKWRGYSLLTLHPSWKAKNSSFPEFGGRRYNPNKWQHQRGTDDAKGRMYNSKSVMMQASGLFRKSFNIKRTDNKHLVYGTTHKLAEEIIGERQVLFVTPQDKSIIGNMFFTFIKKKIGAT